MYNGAMYEAAVTRGGAGGSGVQAVKPIMAEAVAKGMEAAGNSMSYGERVMAARESYIRKGEADLDWRKKDGQYRAKLNEGFEAPNGTAKSFFDKDGQLRAEKLAGLVQKYQGLADEAVRGVVDPSDREDMLQKVRGWQSAIELQAEAARADHVRRRAEDTFKTRYAAAMDMNDTATARELAWEAAGREVIDSDTAGRYAFGADKREVRLQVEKMLVAGDVEGIQGMIDRGELNKWMTPIEQENFLRRGKEMRKERSMEALQGVWTLPAEQVGKAKRPWEVTGAFTQAQARLINRMMQGEDVSAQLRAEAINEARAYPASEDYEKWAAGYAMRWKALGLSDGEISKALGDAAARRKRMEGTRVIEAKIFENSVRNLTGALSPDREAALMKVIYDKKGKIQSIFKQGSEWRQQNEGRWGISADDDERVAAGKYYKRKYEAIMDEQLALVNNKYNEWLDTEEGQRSTPVAQQREYQAIFKEVCKRDIVLRDVAGYENAYRAVLREQDAQHERYMRGGYVEVDYSQYTGYTGRGEVGILEGAERKEAGVYLPEGLKGKVKPGKDGVLCIGEHGGCRELPVLGFAPGEQLQISREAAAEMAVNPNEPPRWQWQVVRADEHERLMEAQAQSAARENIRRGYVPQSVSAARVMPQPGYNEPASAERVKSYMGPQLAAHYDTFLSAARENNLDPRLLISIAMNESARGTSYAARTRHNLFGRWDANAVNPRTGARGYHKYYRDADESIRDIARHLRREYIDKGLRSIEAIGRKYAPVGAENDPRGLNGGWAAAVGKFYQQLSAL